MEKLWEYTFTIGPGTTQGAWLELLSVVGGENDMYIHSVHTRTTPYQFAVLVRSLRRAGLEVCDMARRPPSEFEDVNIPLETDDEMRGLRNS